MYASLSIEQFSEQVRSSKTAQASPVAQLGVTGLYAEILKASRQQAPFLGYETYPGNSLYR